MALAKTKRKPKRGPKPWGTIGEVPDPTDPLWASVPFVPWW